MDWSKYGERQGLHYDEVVLVHARRDRDDPWLNARADLYRKEGKMVTLKTWVSPKTEGDN